MRYGLRTLLVVMALGPPAVGALVGWQRLNWTNCGGNNAALADVQLYTLIAQLAAEQSPTGEFIVTSATAEQRKELSQLVRDHWIGDADFLVSIEPYHSKPSGPPRIVIVCSRPFTNVPRYVFGEPPPTYAAAFTDGSTALLTERQFGSLDRSLFVSLNELIAQAE